MLIPIIMDYQFLTFELENLSAPENYRFHLEILISQEILLKILLIFTLDSWGEIFHKKFDTMIITQALCLATECK